jgi:hypothetical protein
MNAYLVPVGHNHFEIYSEPPEDVDRLPEEGAGRLRRWGHTARVRWHDLVDTARRGSATGRFAVWRDKVVCRLAETIAEQRTLWALGKNTHATLRFPSTLDQGEARTTLDRALMAARRHHGLWLAIDGPLFVVSGALMPVPGPNILAYYLAFRVIGHWLSWRGARQSLNTIVWTLEPDADLAELGSLVDVPRALRDARVAAIAARLQLPRLSAFFERVAA